MTESTTLGYSEDELIEKPAIDLFKALGWESYNGYREFEAPGGSLLGREHMGEIVLRDRLITAMERLNPGMPREAFERAFEEIVRDRSAVSLAEANRQVYKLLKDGVKVTFRDPEGRGEVTELVQVMDWNEAGNNDFLLVSQFWVAGEMGNKRADLVGFVNGIPLVFIELKAIGVAVRDAYDNNLRDYKDTIPHIFWCNGFIILSNGSESVVGSATAAWEHFGEWKKINSEGEEGVVSLETMIRGTCDPVKLIDIVENFTIFQEVRGGLIKLVARNHQYLGVNKAIEGLRNLKENKGRLGVFWHTQGSGKSVSMIFFSQKILRKIPGNWTFVVVTDRTELDGQIYKEFASAGVVTEKEAQPTSSAHLRTLLAEDHRYVFTLIQKFLTEKGGRHPVVSERSDIIVITDEAHRSQYDTLAMNMRTALPNAAFIAFTGTPLIAGEEKTKDVFGEYVSIYDFGQSVEDKATVPLYYENRIPELQLTNEDLNEDIYEVIEETTLDEGQEKKLEREFSRQYHLIIREDRLERIAQDLVEHFMARGFRGKAMVVSIDKATAVRMYDRVQKYWKRYIEGLRERLPKVMGDDREKIQEEIRYMEETDMAVVVSQGQNEIEELKNKGVDIKPHRKRMVKEDLDTKFKDPADPFRIVFVCAMWMTGFDVPSCSTIYLDKPMRNHTLMQTIARANRVFREKVNGLIVDYVGVFRNLQKALAIYGSGPGGTFKPGERPVEDKSELVKKFRELIAKVEEFCVGLGVTLPGIKEERDGFERIKKINDAMDKILVNDESKKRYLASAGDVKKVFRAILPHPLANELEPDYRVIVVIAQKIQSLAPEVDISNVMGKIEEVLDGSIAAEGYVIDVPVEGEEESRYIDLSMIDFEALRRKFLQGRKHTEAEKLKQLAGRKITSMFRLNRTRVDYLEKFQKMIEEYNAGSINVEKFFEDLVKLVQELTEEEQRHINEQLSEEELAIVDLLTKPEMELKKKERMEIKKVARELLEKLKREKLVLDWRKRQQSRAAVRLTIEETLDRLPECYTKEIYERKCNAVYQHVYECYFGAGKSVYAKTA